MELAKTYSPQSIETKWYPIWEKSGYFKPSFKANQPDYSIVLPPPNVTGTLHMGHGFQHTVMDILIRYHRMRGFNTLWQPGTDHAGIATQIVVERQLDQQNMSRHDLGREVFVDRVWQWKNHSGDTITRQMRRLGSSCDWSRERFTMDEGLSKAVSRVFINLYNKGYIYRGKRLVNWDVELQSAVSDLEVISQEETGSLWHIRYPIKNSNEHIVIATTRPETMLGDTAIAINPNDERYNHLLGKFALLPLVGREIPIITDDYVDKDFGTGCVKITPAHDFNDYEVGKRNNLEMISIFTLDGHINENAPVRYRNLERFIARKLIIDDLEKQGFLVEIKPHVLQVPRGDRTGVIIEPLLTDQWFVKMDKFANDGLELVNSGQIKFVPENWKVTYQHWLESIQDWCISRQLWWGHRIPAYYDENDNCYVADSMGEAVKLAGTDKLTQDEDVLDTWFSSALWPFSTLGWPEDTQELQNFLPTNVLVTGFDIIFFWVARMIMFTHEFTNKIPFKEVYVTGLIQDAQGNKMSKSKGNIVDPLDLINGISLDELIKKRTQNLMNPKQAETISKQTHKDYPNGFEAFGADALRFTFASLATHGREIRFDVKRIEGSRNFCNKLWNATKFVLMNADNQKDLIGKIGNRTFIDNCILGQLQQLIKDLDFAYSTYRFDIAAQRLYEFVWNDYCDWYVELAKVNLQSLDDNIKTATVNTLIQVLECVLRLTHPVMPFITEELWQVVAEVANKKQTPSIMIADYPKMEEIKLNDYERSRESLEELKVIITQIRNLRGEMNLNPGLRVPLIIEGEQNIQLTEFSGYIKALAKVSDVNFVKELTNQLAPVTVINGVRMMLEVEIDKDAEKIRLNKEIEKNNKELEKIKIKLDNPEFIKRAPQDLVERDKLRLEELQQMIKRLNQQVSCLN